MLEPSLKRASVPDDKVRWDVVWTDYAPIIYTSAKILQSPHADPDFGTAGFKNLKFNSVDRLVNRTSHLGKYVLDGHGLPLNPCGRTGIQGRGCLRYWGPNHAADPIVSRWKVDATGKRCQPPILQFVSILRQNGQWAFPGGMVDAGEEVTSTLKREFSEEALNSTVADPLKKKAILEKVEQAFRGGVKIYAGYVDDPRNTDNAWMETVAVNFHDETGTGLALFPLEAGDDASAVRWTDVSSELELYANHRDLLQLTAQLHGAHW
ncbi:Nudix (nucleoside diphosphate linked moiety X)-type motif 9 [Sparganum proliferum]